MCVNCGEEKKQNITVSDDVSERVSLNALLPVAT